MSKKLSLTPYLFLSPALILLGVFVVYPILAVIYYSFTDYNIISPPAWVGLQNYQQLAQDPIMWQALGHSLIYLLVTPTLIVLSIVLAIGVNRKLPGIQFFRALFFIPVISGTIAVSIAWRMMLDTNGIINSFFIALGLLREPVQWMAEPRLTLPICMLLTTWMGLGYYMMIFLAGLQNIPDELYDAALMDGCNNFQKHWHVSVPGLRPQITFVAVISSMAALQVFNEVYILTGGQGGILNSGVTVVLYLWRVAFRLNHAGYASAIAMVLLAITLAFSVFNIRLQERGGEAS
jgi:putative chitobiose transport system permease protein